MCFHKLVNVMYEKTTYKNTIFIIKLILKKTNQVNIEIVHIVFVVKDALYKQ